MEITLYYNLKDTSLDSVFELSSSLKKNIDAYNKWEGILINSFLSLHDKNPNYRVNILSNLEECLRPVTYSFLHNCGIPNFVYVNKDYSLIEELLNNEGKTLKRKFNGLAVGKHVVDKK